MVPRLELSEQRWLSCSNKWDSYRGDIVGSLATSVAAEMATASAGWGRSREVAAHGNVLAPCGVADRKMSLETTCHAVLIQLDEVSSCGNGHWSETAAALTHAPFLTTSAQEGAAMEEEGFVGRTE